MDKIYRCLVTCTFRVNGNYEEYIPITNAPFIGEEIVGFKLPDGRIVRPVIGMEVESKDGQKFKDITDQKGLSKLGLYLIEYDTKDFEEIPGESEEIEHEAYESMPIDNLPVNLEPRFESTKEIIERRLKERRNHG